MSQPNAIARGLAWNTIAQLVQIALSFASMLVLVRIIPASEYGRATSTGAVFMLFSSFSAGTFLSHSLQLADGEEPDWDLHWAFAWRIQLLYCAIGQLLATAAWFLPRYRPIAPLLHMAACAFLLEAPALLRFAQLRRELDFRRMRIATTIGTIATIAITLVLGLHGAGAYALVLGTNLLPNVPFVVDLLFIRRYRPKHGWFGAFDRSAYRASFRFGAQRGGLGVMFTVRNALPGLVLPTSLGFGAIGELSRSQSLVNLTAGRGLGVLFDTLYPFLPRHAHDAPRLRHYGRLLATLLGCVLVPALVFLTLEKQLVVDVLYGGRWSVIIPLVPAAAVGFAGQACMTLGSSLLLAKERMRGCFFVDAIATVVAALTIFTAPFLGLRLVAWGAALSLCAGGLYAVVVARDLLDTGTLRAALLGPVVSTLAGAIAIVALAPHLVGQRPLVQLLLLASGFGLVTLAVARLLFAGLLVEAVRELPGGRWLAVLLRLDLPAVELT